MIKNSSVGLNIRQFHDENFSKKLGDKKEAIGGGRKTFSSVVLSDFYVVRKAESLGHLTTMVAHVFEC